VAEQELTRHANETLRRPTAELVAEGEGAFVEFKESARWSHIQGDKDKMSELDVLRTLAGFMNAKGGTLLIGVHDTDGPMGLARDYKSLQKRPNRDGFENWLTTDVIRLRLGAQVMRIPLGSIPHAG
jgi:predicted HTH transcriptional regulator